MSGEDDGTAVFKELRLRVHASLLESGRPQRELARLSGIEETKLSKSLSGKRGFKADELIRIATALGVTVNWLMTGSDSAAAISAAPDPHALPTRLSEKGERGKKRREILVTAWHLFAERGFEDVSIAEIASRCDITGAAVHYHFATKRELFDECLRYCVKLAFDRQVASLEPTDGLVDRLKHLVELQLPAGEALAAEWAIWLQSWSAVAVGKMSREDHGIAYARWYETIRNALQEGSDSGVFSCAAAEDTAMQLTSLIDGLGIKVLLGMIEPAEMRRLLHSFIDSCATRETAG